MTAATPAPEPINSEVVYLGRRTASAGKLAYAYAPATLDGPEAWWPKPLIPGAAVGSRLQLTHPADEPDKVYTKGKHAPRLVGQTSTDDDTMLGWQIADRAAYEAKSQEDGYRRAAKAADRLEAHLVALDEAARRLPARDRAAFARYVSDRVRGVS